MCATERLNFKDPWKDLTKNSRGTVMCLQKWSIQYYSWEEGLTQDPQ